MRTTFLLLLAALALAAWNFWLAPDNRTKVEGGDSPSGFVVIGPGRGLPADTVIIMAPPNCSSPAGQRARELTRQLSEKGIPNIIRAEFRLDMNPDEGGFAEVARQMKRVFESESPPVLINRMGGANPTLEEIVAEYRAD